MEKKNRRIGTSVAVGGAMGPAYVQGAFEDSESELASKEGNLSLSRLRTEVEVEGEVVDKTHCGKEEAEAEAGSLIFAA